MATALQQPHLEPASCAHAAFVPYGEPVGDFTDDTITMKGRCPECEHFWELWTSRTTGEIYNERELSYAEARALREAYES